VEHQEFHQLMMKDVEQTKILEIKKKTKNK